MPDTNRTWLLARRPDGRPSMDCFELVERDRATPDTGEVALRILYLSVDPYMRDRMRAGESYSEPWAVGEPLRAGVVAEVTASEHDRWAVGDVVVTGGVPWAEYAVVDGDRLTRVDPTLAPVSKALGVLGMPGRTAYFGLLAVGDPTPGDTVLVTAAAGAVGSVVGQLARHAGCDVIGIAGSQAKLDWLDELGFDETINRREDDIETALATVDDRYDGIDIYYDNVGGEITDAAFRRLAVGATVVVCGQVALYNATSVPQGPRKLPGLIETRARVEGFLVRDFRDRYQEATERLARWVDEGVIEYRETVTEGLTAAPEAFLDLFDGENIGKQVVKIADPTTSTD